MTLESNPYCERLGIAVPSLAAACTHRDANTYALLIVTLLEKGQPMTLADVALRFHAAGVAHADDAYDSLKRCRPARPPVYRDGDLYALDPHDHELDLWAFRLGLRPPKVVHEPPSPPPPRPPIHQRLSVAELDTAWRKDANIFGWSAQRIALAILDAHDRPMQPDEVVRFVSARTKWHKLAAGPTTFRRTGAAVAVRDEGAWSIIPGAQKLGMARDAVRDATTVDRNVERPAAAAVRGCIVLPFENRGRNRGPDAHGQDFDRIHANLWDSASVRVSASHD